MSHSTKDRDIWLKTSEQILDTLAKMRSTPTKDRLDSFCRVRACLLASHRSINGWMGWVNNADIFHFVFTDDELKDFSLELISITERLLKLDNKLRRAYHEKEKSHKVPQFSPDQPFYM